jgi:uncharacterized protein YigE (DUF2233 family)
MPGNRIPVGRLSALLAVVVGAFVVFHGSGSPRFKSLGAGMEFGFIRGEPYCRSGSAQIAVLRFDPAKARLRVHHYTSEPSRRPLNILQWRRRTSALAVFNAGQYYPDLSYMGILVSDGKVVSPRLHPGFKAMLVSSPLKGGRGARVIDLAFETFDEENPAWKDVAQSFMLFDRTGKIRTRKSGQVANRTVVAEDRHGRLLVITSEGAYTLYEFATLLQESPLHLIHGMAMDGGHEAELCVEAGNFRYASFGPWDGQTDSDALGARVPLPAVVSVSRE